MKCLFVAPTPPWPPDNGGRVRTYELLRALRPLAEVHLRVVSDGGSDAKTLAALAPVVASVKCCARSAPSAWQRLTRPKVERWFHSAELATELERDLAGGRHDVIHADELFVVRAVPRRRGAPLVVHHHKLDLEFFADLPGPAGPARAFDLWKLARLERFAARRTRFHVVTSAEDARRLAHRRPGLALAVVESGFDPARFTPGSAARDADELLFVGSLDYAPNVDGLAWFAREVLPLVRAARPSVRLTVIGSGPTDAAGEFDSDGVRVLGRVDDVVPYLRRAGAFVAPLLVGGGTRLKLVEAAACEIPIVSTRAGAEGLAFEDGEHLSLADAPAEFARAALDALAGAGPRDAHGEKLEAGLGGASGLVQRRAARARELVELRYRWSDLASRLVAAWERAAASARGPGPDRGV